MIVMARGSEGTETEPEVGVGDVGYIGSHNGGLSIMTWSMDMCVPTACEVWSDCTLHESSARGSDDVGLTRNCKGPAR